MPIVCKVIETFFRGLGLGALRGAQPLQNQVRAIFIAGLSYPFEDSNETISSIWLPIKSVLSKEPETKLFIRYTEFKAAGQKFP